MTKKAGLALSLVVATTYATAAFAQPSSPVPEVIRYDGFVELEGRTLDESLGFRFTLYGADGSAVWSEEYSDEADRSCDAVASCLVPTYRGRFSVDLGAWADITDAVTGQIVTEAEDVGTGGAIRDGGTTYLLGGNSSTADAVLEVPAEGDYVFAARAYQNRAGPDDAHMTLRVDDVVVAEFDVAPTSLATSGIYQTQVHLLEGSQTFGVRFTNDFFVDGDRNLLVDWFALEGEPDALELGVDVRHPTNGTCVGGDNTGAACVLGDDTCSGDGAACALSWASLAGRQQLSSLPYALWTLQADEFVVADTLFVAGAVESVGTLTAYSDVTLTGNASANVVSAQSVSTDIHYLVSSEASADGTVSATGDLIYTTSLQLSGQNLVGGSQHTWNIDNDFAGGTRIVAPFVMNHTNCGVSGFSSGRACSLQINGTTTLEGSLVFVTDTSDAAGTEVARIDGDRPIFVFEFFGYNILGTGAGGHNTGISTADYHCFIGTTDFLGGDIEETTASNIFKAYTYRQSGTWRLTVNWNSENDEELHAVVVWCLQSGLADMPASWFQ